MAQFRPQFSITRTQYNSHLFDYNEYHKYFVFPTYRELKQKMVSIMKEYKVDEICVSRSRRGEWGEWFEYWNRHGDKLVKGREGWM